MEIGTPDIYLLKETGAYSLFLVVYPDGYAKTMQIDKKGRVRR